MKPTAGTMVNPRVRLLKQLGRGAMGSVWIGEHLTLETDVAVKFIKPELSPEEGDGLIERFKREAKAAAKIKSPHVVQTLDQGFMDDGTPYIVMELLEGETLGERLARTGRIRQSEAEPIVSQVCRGLAKAHELGIVHRDIKPDNLFLVGAGDELLVKILDFGVAKQVKMPAGAATASGTLVGTPQYMSPEQLLRAEELSPQVDLWALAVVIYQALLGRPPFEGETLAGIIVAITHGKYARPSSVDERLAGPVDEWFDRALALEATDRFAHAKEFADAFRAAVADLTDDGAEPSELGPEQVGQARGAAVSESTASELADTAQFIVEEKLDVSSAAVVAPTRDTGPATEVMDDRDTPAPVSEPAGGSDREEELLPRAASAATAGAVKTPTLRSESTRALQSARARKFPVAPVLVGAAVVGLIGWYVTTRDTKSPVTPSSEPSASARTAPGTGPAAAAAASSAPAADPAASGAPVASAGAGATTRIGPLAVDPGRTPDGTTWLPAFRLVHEPAAAGQTYLAAHAVCRKRSMALCTESQWLRACHADAVVGSQQVWTATGVADEGFVARGGDGTCGARLVAAPTDATPERGGLCCARVVGIRSSNTNDAFLESTATKLARIERAFTTGNTGLLSSLVEDNVRYRDAVLTRRAFVDKASKLFQLKPDGWILHDVCDVALFDQEGKTAWSADCSCVVQQGKRLGFWMRRYEHSGESGKLRSIEVPKVFREATAP